MLYLSTGRRRIGIIGAIVAMSASTAAQTPELSSGCYWTSSLQYGATPNSFSSMGTPSLLSSASSISSALTTSPVSLTSSTLSISLTTTATTPTSTLTMGPFYIDVNDGTTKARRAIEYVGFQGNTSVLVDSKDDAALFTLTADGYLMSGGQYVSAGSNGTTGILQLSQTLPKEPFPWTFNSSSVSFGDSRFCYLSNGDFVTYNGDQPDECALVTAAIELAPQTTTSTSMMSSTEVETSSTETTTTTTGTTVLPSGLQSSPLGTSSVSGSVGGSSPSLPPPASSPSTSAGLAISSHSSYATAFPLLSSSTSQPLLPSPSTSAGSSTSSAGGSSAIGTLSSLSGNQPMLYTSSTIGSLSRLTTQPSSTSPSGSQFSLSASFSFQTPSNSGLFTTSPVSSPSTSSSTSSSSASSSPTPSLILPGKRGLAYTNVNTTVFYPPPSQVSWAYNYYSLPNRSTTNVGRYPYTASYPLKFYPLLFNDNSGLTSVWSANVNYSIANYGTDAIFSFNEPDACFGGLSACMTVSQALAAYQSFIQPFAGRVLLGAPAVTNAGSGFTWLSQFLGNATLMNLTVDFINIHWYASPYNEQYFQDYMAQAASTAAAAGYPNRPIWITEYGMDQSSYAEPAVLQFLRNTTYWVDIQPSSFIAKTCWFGNFANNLLNANSTARSPRGDIWNAPSTGYVYGFSKKKKRRNSDYLAERAAVADGGGLLDGWELVQDDDEDDAVDEGPEEIDDEVRGKWNWKDVGTGMDEAWLKVVRGEE